MKLDPFLTKIGALKGGWYPIGPYFCMWLLLICHAMHVMTGSFAAWTPEGIKCAEGSPTDNEPDFCVATFNETNSTCQSWTYGEVTELDLTLVRDFDLVCSQDTITMLINTLYVAGVFFGNIFLGSLPDQFGRKNVCLLGNVMLGVIAFIFAFSNDVYTILILRFIGGLFYSMTQFTVWMWVTELFSTKDRFLPVSMAYHGWSSGMVIISGVAYLVPSWRHLHLVVMCFCFTAIPLYLVLPESLYWLERNKRKKQSAAIMMSIQERDCFVGLHGNNAVLCFKNNSSVSAVGDEDDSDNEADDSMNMQKKEQKSNIDDACSNNNNNDKSNIANVPEKKRRRSRTASSSSMTDPYAFGTKEEPKTPKLTKTYWICMVLCSSFWFIDGLLYYGLQFSTAEFAGDRFLNFFLFSVVEYPATILAFILGKFTTRRFSLLLLHLMCGLAMITSALLRWTDAMETATDGTKQIVFNTLNITAKFFVTACFSVMCYVPAEVFPTNVRNTSFNINASFSRIAAIIGTFMPLMFRSNPAAAECVFGLMGIFAGMTAFFLPETKNSPLPQTMADLEGMAKRTGSIFKMNY